MGFRGSAADGPLFISAHIVTIIIMILMRDALASGAYISFQEENNNNVPAALWKKGGKNATAVSVCYIARAAAPRAYFRYNIFFLIVSLSTRPAVLSS
jgi:hypothetical protein